MNMSRNGFTFLEILITVSVLLIVCSIATPYYLRYREASCRTSCVANMMQLQSAVSMAKMAGVPEPNVSELIGPKSFLKKMPTCPNNHAPYTKFDPPECPAGDNTHMIPPKETET